MNNYFKLQTFNHWSKQLIDKNLWNDPKIRSKMIKNVYVKKEQF